MRTPVDHGLEPVTPMAALRDHLDVALGDACLPTGTRDAHALYDLALSEARQRGEARTESAWLALDAGALAILARQLEKTVWHGSRDFTLPAGTVMMEAMQGSTIVERDHLGFDVDTPGLHDVLDLPDRPGGSNLELLVRRVDELSAGLPCRALGPPTLVDRFERRHPEHHLQFRPHPPAGGVVLQREMSFSSWGQVFCAFTTTDIDWLAAKIVADMQALWTGAERLAPRIAEIRRQAEAIAARQVDVRVHAVTIDMFNQLYRGEIVTVEFEALDHSLRRGIVVRGASADDLSRPALEAAGINRAATAATLAASGADGTIGGLARAIVEAAPSGPAAVLQELADGFECFVTLPTRTRPLRIRLHWQNGEIVVSTRDGPGIEVEHRVVTLRYTTFPEALVDSLPGCPFHAVLDSPFRCGSPISRAENRDGNVVITTAPDRWPVNCRTGNMWPDANLIRELPEPERG